jgi:simple sugar transport system ATP-binding protein
MPKGILLPIGWLVSDVPVTHFDQTVLRAVDITKTYGPVVANSGVSVDLRAGEIHAVLGENGAGKSTFMKVLYGLEIPDSGYVELRGEELQLASPSDAIRAGIGMVHQHFMLVPTLTVLENLILGSTIGGKRILNTRDAATKISALAKRFGMTVDLDVRVAQLSVGEQQKVEILKALVRGATILILDEPTAVLTPQEITQLLVTLRDLSAQGISILLVTHKLAEVMEVADRASVMRAGRLVGTWNIAETTSEQLVAQMIGRSRNAPAERLPRSEALGIVLELAVVNARGSRGDAALHKVSLRVHAGEIVGIAGVEGNGQRELAEVITGLLPIDSGDVVLGGRHIDNAPTADILELGVGHIPEDRHKDGLVLDFSIAENAILVAHSAHPFQRRGVIRSATVEAFAERLIRDFKIRCNGPDTPIRNLSGGNQQKLILGREIARTPKLLIAMQPTRGLDIGAIDYVHAELTKLRNEGVAILLVSAELDELFALADRIAVMREGRIVGVVDRADATIDGIGNMMLGEARLAS